MKTKETIAELLKEQRELGQKIMTLSNTIYFDEDTPSKDLLREQRQAMDNYYEVLEARILDLQQNIDDDEEDEKDERNFLDDMFDDLNIDLEDMLTDLRKRCHDLEDKHSSVVRMEDMEGKKIINVNPPKCHECSNYGKSCHKLIMAGNQHICVQ